MGKKNNNGYLRALWLSFLFGFLITGQAQADTVCAQVKIEIQQELTLERQAFDAMMRINNGLDTFAIEDVEVNVSFSDENGNSVLATTDPNDTNAKFFIRVDSMENISDVSGSGTVAPSSTAEIHWLIIPAPGAAQDAPGGKLYFVGATLNYTFGGEPESVEVTPDTITVKPLPQLTLDYFLPRDVLGNDPLTAEIEPIEPYTLGVRVSNNGLADANSVKIDSAQPTIVENEQGLQIGFEIIGSSLDDQPSAPVLLMDFGTVKGNSARVGRWQMTSTLAGTFTDFTASFSHADELGGAVTSILEATNTHTLVQDVLVDLPGRDSVRDFLALDGNTYRVYESGKVDNTVVTDQSGQASYNLSGQSGTRADYTLTLPATSGFVYVKLPDPHNGEKIIASVIRSDGKKIPTENAWVSKTRNRDTSPPSWEYHVNFFDVNTTGTYAVYMNDEVLGAVPPVIQFIPARTTYEGEQVGFLVEASDPNGQIPVLSADPLPAGAGFIDNGNGTAFFNWTPAIGQAGTYTITYTASDGALTSSRTAIITVDHSWDTDGDGMDDAWELDQFGNLDHDGTADSDGDGISDLQEYLDGTDPNTPAPVAPDTLKGVSGDREATLTWDVVDGATSYRLYWSETAGVTKQNGTLVDNAVSPYVHGELSNGSTYYYVVTSVGPGGESVVSAEVAVTPGLRYWGAPGVVEQSSGDVKQVRTAFAGNGTAMAVWIQNDGSRDNVWASLYTVGSGWAAPQQIEFDDTADAGEVRLAMNADGNAVAVWTLDNGVQETLWSSSYQAAGVWSTPVSLATVNSGALGDISVVLDNGGVAHAVWMQSADGVATVADSVWSSALTGGSWSTAQRVDGATGSRVLGLQLAAADDGSALAVWSQTADDTQFDLVASRYSGAAWEAAQILRSGMLGDEQMPQVSALLTMNSQGEAVLVWGEASSPNRIHAQRYVPGSGWEAQNTVPHDYTRGAYQPSVAMDDNGNAVVLWTQSDGIKQSILSNRYLSGSGWQGTATRLSADTALTNIGDTAAPMVRMDGQGNIVAVWQQQDGVQENIWSARFDQANGWSAAEIIETQNQGDALMPQLAMDSAGNAVSAWRHSDGGEFSLAFNDLLSGNSGVPNIAPVVVLPADHAAPEQTVISIDAGSSFDQDGAIQSYAWEQVSGTQVTINNADTAVSSFTTPTLKQPEALVFRVTVTDDQAAVSSADITITVNPVNTDPVVDAGADQTVDEQTAVTLTGGASDPDADGTIQSYAWSQVSGTTVALTNADTNSASFTAPTLKQQAILVFRLTATDDEGGVASDDVSVTVNPVNTDPVVDAGADRIVDEQTPVTLSAIASDPDADGVIQSYAWSQVSGTTVSLTNADSAEAGFIAPTLKQQAVLVFQVTATDDEGGTASDTVAVAVNPVNHAPTVDAGTDQIVDEQAAVVLSAAASDPDADGVIQSYAWSQVSGTTVSLTNVDSAQAGFTAPTLKQQAVLVFRVDVTDDEGGTASDEVTVTVNPVNHAPVVDAGVDQTVDEQTAVTLTGSASDPDADGVIQSYTWSQVSGTQVTLSNADTSGASFTAPTLKQQAVLVFRLTVTDDEGGVTSDDISVTVNPVNHAPVVDAGADQTVDEQSAVTLTGSASDPDADGVIQSYAWSQVSGTAVTLTNADSAEAGFTAPTLKQQAVLVFRLTVTDDENGVASDDVAVTVNPVNTPPVVDAGLDQTVDEQTTVTLTAIANDPDADGVIQSYVWSQLSGTTVTLSNANNAEVTFTAPTLKQQATLVFQVTVTDDEGGVDSDEVTITVNPVNTNPVVDAGADQTADENSLVTLTATASDPDADGVILSYAWSQISGIPVTLNHVDTESASFTAPAVYQDTQLGFRVAVVDDEGGTAEDTILVTIQSVNPDDDADGMDDLWEITHFATLDRDGTADADSDGATDRMEFDFGTDPNVPNGPGQPSILSPDGTEVTSLQPQLVLVNGDHHPEFTVTYQFEVYGDPAMTQLVTRVDSVTEGTDNTSWSVDVVLNDNTRYYWRARAVGWVLISEWVNGDFFVNTVNDAPGSFNISSPADGVSVDTFTPLLTVTNSHDVDEDILTYGFEVYPLGDPANSVASVSGVGEGAGGTTEWQVDQLLLENHWYTWRSTVIDEHGAQTSTSTANFFVNTVNDAPSVPVLSSPPDGEEITATQGNLVVENATDPESAPLVYLFELDTVATFDSSERIISPQIAEGDTTTSWYVEGLRDNTWYYWRAKASDGETESAWVQGRFFVNTVNDAPSIPAPENPGDGAWAGTMTPTLSVYPSVDVDEDTLRYEFEVYLSDRRGRIDARLTGGVSDTTSWQTAPDLPEAGWYYWRARAIDEHGLESDWSEYIQFFADNDGVNDVPEIKLKSVKLKKDMARSDDPDVTCSERYPANGRKCTTEHIEFRWKDRDPDSNATIRLYYRTSGQGSVGTLITDAIKEDPDGRHDRYQWDVSALPSGIYFLYAEIDDGNSTSVSHASQVIILGDGGGHPYIELKNVKTQGGRNQKVTIQWEDVDADSNAVISLYYDADAQGEDGGLIVSGLNENPDGRRDKYVWKDFSIPPGEYYIYAVIQDETSTYVDYFEKPIRIQKQRRGWNLFGDN